jgi:hypothetical protein
MAGQKKRFDKRQTSSNRGSDFPPVLSSATGMDRPQFDTLKLALYKITLK